jgi:cytochrome oxidase Cu insertion factor (SCO1/SenC/PrrC family)
MNTPAVATRPKRGVLLLLLMLLFFAPLLLAFLIYYGSGWRPAGRTNHGVLILPARSLPQVALPQVALPQFAVPGTAASASAPDGEAPAAASVFSGKWSLVYIGRGDCDAECRNTLYFMRQTHFGLANLIPRVQRVFLVTADCCDREFLAREQPKLITLNAQGSAGAALLALFPGERRAASIFVVDPRGNLMMRYDAHEDPKGLRDDLKKLLALSHIG